MILEWMLYTFAVTLLFAWAAWALEEIAVGRGFPARVIWIVAVMGSLLLPQALHLRPRTGPSVTISIRGVSMPWEASDRDGSATSPEALSAATAARDFENELKVIWGASSLLVLALFATSAGLVAGRRRRWKVQVMNRRRIWISADTGPAVVGFFPGEIVLPEWMLSSPSADRRLAITHEEEHIRARDPLIVFAIAVACAAMPWNLPLWWIASRLRRAIELDCDRRLVTFGFNRRSYSRLLIEVTERGLPHYMAVTGMSGTPSFLEKRIRLLLGRKPQSPIRSGALVMAASMVLLVAYSIDPPAGQAEERVGVARVPGFRMDEAVEIFEVTAGAMLREVPGVASRGRMTEDALPAERQALSGRILPSGAEANADDIEVCVVQDGRLAYVTANYRPATGDTLLGTARFSDVHPATAPNYARGESWFEEKSPVTFVPREQGMAADSVWVPFGVNRLIEPALLESVGELNGVTVFAEAGFRMLHVFYIPVEPGCVFRAYQVRARIRY